jgi:hypothetical protein
MRTTRSRIVTSVAEIVQRTAWRPTTQTKMMIRMTRIYRTTLPTLLTALARSGL